MPKKKVFLSYDYEGDKQLKGSFVSQARHPDSPFSITDISLEEKQPDPMWISKAQSAIARCDLFIILLGKNTHQAPGVLKEVKIAKGLDKEMFQLKPQRRKRVSVQDAGEVVLWKWKNLRARFG